MSESGWTEQDVRRAAKEHAAAMQAVYDAHNQLGRTAGKLAAMVDPGEELIPQAGSVGAAADTAMGLLGRGYEAMRVAFNPAEADTEQPTLEELLAHDAEACNAAYERWLDMVPGLSIARIHPTERLRAAFAAGWLARR